MSLYCCCALWFADAFCTSGPPYQKSLVSVISILRTILKIHWLESPIPVTNWNGRNYLINFVYKSFIFIQYPVIYTNLCLIIFGLSILGYQRRFEKENLTAILFELVENTFHQFHYIDWIGIAHFLQRSALMCYDNMA